jgi:hypothetical protein
MAGEKVPVITRETLIPIGVAISCLAPIALGTIWIRDSMAENAAAIASLRSEMISRFNILEAKSGDRWTTSEMQLWSLKLQRDNPTIKVPEVSR